MRPAHLCCKDEVCLPHSAPLRPRTLYVLGSFPTVSQTFIYRELHEIRRVSGPLHILPLRRTRPVAAATMAAELDDTTKYLDHASSQLLRRFDGRVVSRRAVAEVLEWMRSLPHRSLGHRLRGIYALLRATAYAKDVLDARYSFIHAHFAGFPTEFAMCLSRLTGIPYGATFHAYDIWRDGNLLAEKAADASVLLACTETSTAYLREVAAANAHKVHVAHHGLDLTRVPPADPVPASGSPLFVALGRLVPKKGLRVLVEAAALLQRRGVEFRVRILGSGPELRALRTAAARFGVDRIVDIPGTAIPNHRVWSELLPATALVAPCVRDRRGDMDGIPNIVLEAMAMRRPVIASTLSGLPEVVEDGTTGLLVPPGDPYRLADAMQTLVERRGLATFMGVQARTMIEQRFDVRDAVAHQLRLVRDAIGA